MVRAKEDSTPPFGSRLLFRPSPEDKESRRGPHSTEPWPIVEEWFKRFRVTIGPMADEAQNSTDQATAEKTARLFYTWRDLFVDDMVEMPATDLVTHVIPTSEGVVPRRARDKLYTLREREWMDWNIPKMLEAGIIDYSISLWCHRTKFVPKKDGDLRMVHNYMPINAATVPNAYPMRRIEHVLNSLIQPGLIVYFQADACNGYWAIPLAQEHAYKTAFGTHRGKNHYLRMGQGLSGAPQTYTHLKDILAGPIPAPNKEAALDDLSTDDGRFQYFMDDDFGVHRTSDSQWRFLHRRYFPRLAWGQFTLRPKKTGFFLERIKPLGFVLQGAGLRPSQDKVAAIRDYPTPQNLDEVNKFLRMTTYLRHFIPGRSDHAVVLKSAAQMASKEEWHERDPGRKDKNGRVIRGPRRVVNWEWGERQDVSFEVLKRAVIERAVYGGCDWRQYHLATDASKTGIGGVLFQLLDCEPGTRATAANRRNMRIIMFFSLRLEGAETRYSTTEQEALAVLRCLEEVSWLVQGSLHQVLVYTEHSALIHLLKHHDAHGKMARWQQKLSHCDIEYVHIPGAQNAIADGMSRMPLHYFEPEKHDRDKEASKDRGTGKEGGGSVQVIERERGGLAEQEGIGDEGRDANLVEMMVGVFAVGGEGEREQAETRMRS